MSQALYRTYRPQVFADVVGQERIVTTLREALRQQRVTHAYLFSGPRGTGKTSVARILAKSVNCRAQKDGEPCQECDSCRAVEQGSHLDIIEIDAASNRGIDEIREIKDRIGHLPVMGSYKVYIVDEVHMLTPEAFNALLKTLEEPPPHVVFILATTEPHKLPLTVLSRCQRYEFQRFTVPEIRSRLEHVAEREQVAVDPDGIELIAEAADGALRDALSLMDQVIAMEGRVTQSAVAGLVGALDTRLTEQLLGALTGGELAPLVEVLSEVYRSGRDFGQIIRGLARHVRDVAVFRQAGAEFFSPYRRELLARINARLPESMPTAAWFEALDVLAEAESRLKGRFPAQLVVELAFFKVQRLLTASGVPAERTEKAPAEPVRETGERARDRSLGLPAGADRFSQVLDRLKRERPSTHALVQPARAREVGEDMVVIAFEYPAHRDIVSRPPHRDVLEEALKSVYGAHVRYDLRVGLDDSPESLPVAPSVDREALKQKIAEWVGEDVRLVGFDP